MFLHDWVQISTLTLTLISFLLILALLNILKALVKLLLRAGLKLIFPFWQCIGASKFILHTLSFGYKIPFSQGPSSVLIIIAQLWVRVIL